ncbi:MAG: branched-chain amino acid aminotransferase [Chitinophagaceae bacterium]|nr:branched-chain amino acid aminotransferase [Chitinophagaceae bacterium]
MEITKNLVKESRIDSFDKHNIQFARIYADHMLEATYENGEWQQAAIIPYGDITMSPATTFIHYGQSIFEGIKAYKQKNGDIAIFRPEENWKRFNISAKRMCLPEVPYEIFMDGMKELIAIDKNWVPDLDGTSLYIRPFLFATDEFIGIRPATKFKFMIINSPAGAYYAEPVKIYVQDKYVRAVPGGVGFAKTSGNYAAAMMPTMEIMEKGYNQNLWLDALEFKYVQEIGTMNVFFVIGDEIWTPSLDEGTILDGITRKSIIELLRSKNMKVVEKRIAIDEIIEAFKNGTLKEAFGAGTAAVIAPIKLMHYKGLDITLPDVNTWEVSNFVRQYLSDIRFGIIEDEFNWMFKVI